MNRSPILLLLVAIVMLPLAGCGDNDGTGPGTSTGPVRPKPGSWYILRNTSYDTTGAVRSTRYDTLTIVATDLVIAARSGVMAFTSTGTRDTIYARFDEANDFVTFGGLDTNHDGTRDGFILRRFPITTHDRYLYNLDTLQASGTFDVLRDSVIYEADEEITVPAGTFKTSRVLQVNDIIGYNSGGAPYSRVRELATYSFAPSIGFYARGVFEHDHLDMSGKSFSRKTTQVFELVGYQVK